MKIRYEDLEVPTDILHLDELICNLATKFPDKERFSLTSQIKRASSSILLNIAEGSARNSKKDFARFITMAMSSTMEVHACLRIAMHRKYITGPEWYRAQEPIKTVWFRLGALRRSQLNS